MKAIEKRCLFVLLTALSVSCICLGGCGEKGQDGSGNVESRADYYEKELGLDKDEAKELASEVEKELNGSSQDVSESANDGSQVAYEKFPRSAEFDKLTLDLAPIQIDDTVYCDGCTVADFMEKVKSSSVEYTYEYNPDKLISGNGYDTIIFQRDGRDWFYMASTNLTKETKTLSGLMVCEVGLCVYANTEDCRVEDYCYFLDGRSGEELWGLSYSQVKELANTVFAGWTMEEKGFFVKDGNKWEYNMKQANGTKFIEIKYTGEFLKNITLDPYGWNLTPDSELNCENLASRISWIENEISVNRVKRITCYHFFINQDTGKVEVLWCAPFAIKDNDFKKKNGMYTLANELYVF